MKINGIVVSSIDYKETSKIVYLYTPFGKKSVKVLEGKKQNKGLLPFITTGNVVEAVITDSSFPTLVEFTQEVNFLTKEPDLGQMDCLHIFLETLSKIPDDSNHARIYPLAKEVIMNIKDKDPFKAISVFLIKMTYVFGVSPDLKACHKCGSANPTFLSLKEGVSYCSSCSTFMDLEKYNIWREYYFDKKKIEDYSDYNYDDLLADIFYYYNYHTGISLRYMFRR